MIEYFKKMDYTVFFRENSQIFLSTEFIQKQNPIFQKALSEATKELSTHGELKMLQAGKLKNGDWSIWLEDEKREHVNFNFFISLFEKPVNEQAFQKMEQSKQLVIIDPGGPHDTVGGSHPGWWSPKDYASRMDDLQRDYFLKVIDEIIEGAKSKDYTIRPDRTIEISLRSLIKLSSQ
jgi:hypothetical protein